MKGAAKVAIAVAATGGFSWLFLRQVDLGRALAEVARLDAWALAAALVAAAGVVALTAARWGLLLAAAGFRVPYGRVAAAVTAGTAVSNTLPARAGDVLRVESVRAERVPVLVAVGTLAAERLLDGLVLAVFLLGGVLLVGVGGPILFAALALAGGSALGLVLATAAARRPERALALARRLPRVGRRAESWASSLLVGFACFRRGRALLLVLAGSLALWSVDLALYAAVGAGLGVDLGLGGFLAVEGVGNLALAVPATAGGAGSFDYLTLEAARGVAVPMEQAAAFTLVVHALVVVPVTLAGAVVLARSLPGRALLPARSGG